MLTLSFRLFGTPIRITIWFWLFAALFGWLMGIGNLGWQIFLVWMVCELIATVVKELGHIVAGRGFGYPGAIVLGGMGGQALGEYERAERWQRIVIYAAGPIAAMLFYVALYFATHPVMSRLAHFGRAEEIIFWGFPFLAFLTLFWCVVNVLPILPNDGGKVMQNMLGYAIGRHEFVVATILSILIGGGVVGYSVYKTFHPEVPYLGDVMRPLWHPSLRAGRFASFDPDPRFIAIMYGFGIVMNLFALFRKPGGAPATRVDGGRSMHGVD